MPISINPFTGEIITRYPEMNEKDLIQKIEQNHLAWQEFRWSSLSERAQRLMVLNKLLLLEQDHLSELVTLEMGKPISQSRAELQKCAWLCEYYAENGATFLEEEMISTEATESKVVFDPIGTVLAVMPWNFPFWQVFRFAVPALMAGNSCLLKHASNVCGCALAIEELFEKAGFKGVFTTLICASNKVPLIIDNKYVKAVTLTGSEAAGKAVAAQAGAALKKSVLELGGSNSFIVAADADIQKAVSIGLNARFQNNGQSCIAAKRFLLHRSIADDYIEGFVEGIKALKHGDPLNKDTDIGPLAKDEFNLDLRRQVEKSVTMGAECLQGAVMNGRIFEAGALQFVAEGMPVFDEETFGPVAAFTIFDDQREALRLHESGKYGLGLSIFTRKPDEWEKSSRMASDGAVFFNEMVKSDPRLPFGGQKASGYGRELSRDGMLEFVNRKVIVKH
jgi:succinate-semialdehyde dehydrogenase/glutarate-semialdehyde dehydrogenase